MTEPKKQQHFVIHQNEIRGSCKASGYGERSFGKGTVNSDDVRWTVVQNHNSLVPAEELEKGMPLTPATDSVALIREARAGAMWGYEPQE